MWREYLSGYMKNNRTAGLSVTIAAFISALLLSLLCGLFYNAWKYEVERIELEEGGWHSRIIGELVAEDLETIRNFANVGDAVVNEKGLKGTEPTADIYFSDKKAVFTDTPLIAQQLGIGPERIVYNYELLAMYLIRGPGDTAPRLLFPLFLLITAAASFSLIIIIHNAFAVSMNARIHQFGIFSSIGATPKQIRACLLQEAAALCAGPLLAGTLLGIAGSAGLLYLVDAYIGSGAPGRHPLVFGYHTLVLALTLFVTVITIWISAWLPARRLSRLTPLEAIKNTGEFQLKRKKKKRLLSLLFGIEGELAGNALKAQKKALRTASLSLIVSFLAFALMQCFFSLSQISTRETYFERYQDVWDIMVTVKDIDVDDFSEAAAVQALDGVKSAIVYQKASAKRIIAEEEMTEDMKSFGGFAQAPANYVSQVDGGWLVNAPIVIMDDQSFAAYCEQIGIAPRLDGAVILNQIRDVTNPDFRHPVFKPYIKAPGVGENAVSVLRQSGSEGASAGHISAPSGDHKETTAAVPVLAYTQEVPALREEYATLDYYELVHFIPASLWKEIKVQIGGTEADSCICVRGKGDAEGDAKDDAALEELNALQDEIARLIEGKYTMSSGHAPSGGCARFASVFALPPVGREPARYNLWRDYTIEQENRIQEYETNNRQIQGMMTVFGAFCVLLAIIGIGNVFSNTLGFVRQRRREFARYMSVGLTPKELKKMFCTEALVIAGRPILISLPIVAVAIGFMLKASYMEVGVFLAEAPYIPILLFMLAILASVALAYYLAWRGVRKISLAEVLRDDTLI